MTEQAIDYTEEIKRGWEAFTRKPVELIVGMFLAQLSMILVVTAGAAMLGVAMMALAVVRGQQVTIGSAFDGYQHFVGSLVLIILLALAIGLGLVACIVPGVALMVMFQWAFYCMADNPELSAVDAMKQSWALAKANIAAPVVAIVVALLLSMVGSLVAVGFLVTTPISMTITAAIYDRARAVTPV